MRLPLPKYVLIRLDYRTAAARRRRAESMFFGEPCRRRDRALAFLYYAMCAGDWADRAENESHLAPLIAGLEQVRTPTRVLDVGTGAGSSAARLAERYPGSWVTAIDSVAPMVQLARKRHARDNLEFRRASAEQLPFADGEFDLVTCLNSLPELGELQRVTRPGAQVVRANTYFHVADDQPHWNQRWEDMGFERQEGANVGPGSWELYRRRA